MSQAYNTRDAIHTERQNVRAKFEVEEVGEYKRVKRFGKRATDGITKGLVFAEEVVVIPHAWDVYFPGGHSVRIESEQEMYRLGYMDRPPMVDMETGEELPASALPLTPKQLVQRATKPVRGAL
jgi:hypothetical protein